MRFKIDENLPVEAAELLRSVGHDTETVHDEELSGASDSEVSRICWVEQRIIVTLDLDFADIRAYPPAQYPGIIVMRLKSQSITNVLSVLARIIPLLVVEPLSKRLWIVDEDRIRIRA
jgi:predicted nuclease of predicted toxin-antitoxin system